jgi:glycine hydroxymethyltransferase
VHRIGITVNRNAVPNDPHPPMVTSGLRIGTSALATRGFEVPDFETVSEIIATARQPGLADDDAADLRSRVEALAAEHQLYPMVRGFTAG